MQESINIYFVRHGETFFNKYGRFQGWSDIDLTKKGILDGHHAGEMLKDIKFDGAYSSDLSRAVKTATYVLEENLQTDIKTPTPLKAFREHFFGTFEGLSSDDAVKNIVKHMNFDPKIIGFSKLLESIGIDKTLDAIKESDPSHDAENASEFWTRINAGFDDLRKNHKNGENILIVSHGAAIRSIASHFSDKPVGYYETRAPENGSVTKLNLTKDDVNIEYYALTEELPK